MPGAFLNDSPGESYLARSLSPPPPRKSKGGGLFSNLSRRFDLERDDEAEQQLQNFLPGMEPNRSQSQPQPAAAAATTTTRPSDDGRVTSPAAVQQNLLNAIKSTRAHGSSTLFAPPRTVEVKEQATYCDSNHAQDLVLVAEAPAGMHVYVEGALAATDTGPFLDTNVGAIFQFESLLTDVAAVYSLGRSAVHIYYDTAGPTIAFNHQGSIFCNLRYFLQLHAAADPARPLVRARVDAAVWWWVVIAHELAHNLEATHNAQHSYYT